MKKEDDDELAISCPHCGTQSRVSVTAAAGDEPPTCPACGTSLEAGPKARKKSKKNAGTISGVPPKKGFGTRTGGNAGTRTRSSQGKWCR
ncbi:MAG: hypothetical protein PVH29_09585 [Candidatus Zixiibacteriota bacterium]